MTTFQIAHFFVLQTFPSRMGITTARDVVADLHKEELHRAASGHHGLSRSVRQRLRR